MNNISYIIGLFLLSLFAGTLSTRAINRFMNNKIKQWSFEYQVFGFGGMLVCIFGMIAAISSGLAWIMDTVYYALNK
jgi:hypothetical protein